MKREAQLPVKFQLREVWRKRNYCFGLLLRKGIVICWLMFVVMAAFATCLS